MSLKERKEWHPQCYLLLLRRCIGGWSLETGKSGEFANAVKVDSKDDENSSLL